MGPPNWGVWGAAATALAAGLHTDNEETLKKIIINVKDYYKNELNKTKKSKGLFHVVDFRHECSRQTEFICQQQQSTVYKDGTQ